jgi:hypothetical protein
MKFIFVEKIDEVLLAALEPAPVQKVKPKPRKTTKKKSDGDTNESKDNVD